jgi:hypothetical protein
MSFYQHKTSDVATLADLRNITIQPNDTDKIFCAETNLIYDYVPSSTALADDLYILQPTSFSGRFIAAVINLTLLINQVNGLSGISSPTGLVMDLTVAQEQANNTTTFQNLNGFAMVLQPGFYEIETRWIFNVNATTTGVAFSYGGTTPFNVYSHTSFSGASTTSLVGRYYAASNTETPTTSTPRINNNMFISFVTVQVTTAGTFAPTFASEVNGGTVSIKRGTTFKIRKIV